MPDPHVSDERAVKRCRFAAIWLSVASVQQMLFTCHAVAWEHVLEPIDARRWRSNACR